jgi:hypothetical protein
MPYITWQKFAAAVQGEDRMKAMHAELATETAEVHPFFDSQLAIVERRVDVELEQAGYATPLDAVTDPLLENAIVGLLVGVLTASLSNREQFHADLHAGALDYFKRLGKGTITVLGATADTTPTADALMMGSTPEQAVFDNYAGDAEIAGILAPLGRVGGYWRY